jgi:hypothetical protein
MSTTRHATWIAAFAAALALMPVSEPVLAQDKQERTVDQYKCRDVMRESGANRDIAIAFLHGYLLGKSGSQSFDLVAIHRQTEAFIDHCLSNPDGKAVDSMTAVKR